MFSSQLEYRTNVNTVKRRIVPIIYENGTFVAFGERNKLNRTSCL